jgi:NAD(P)-dependent dehydrogenase (short-subunit alcohol dehydrogenase family)
LDVADVERPLAVVTGATSGFGEAAVHHLARTGRDICLVARSADRAAAVRAAVAAHTPEASLDVALGDLSSFRAVEQVADRIRGLGRPIALLLNNAGAIFGFRRRESVDGVELTMALNHFAYHQLAVRLVDRVAAAAPSRIVNVASNAYESAGGRFDFEHWSAERGYRPFRQYARSKLANILFTKELAERVRGSRISVVAWSPSGLTATRFAYGTHRIAPLAMKLTHPFALETDRAVESLLVLCDRPIRPDEDGAFFVGEEIDPVGVAPREDARRLWGLTARILGMDQSLPLHE